MAWNTNERAARIATAMSKLRSSVRSRLTATPVIAAPARARSLTVTSMPDWRDGPAAYVEAIRDDAHTTYYEFLDAHPIPDGERMTLSPGDVRIGDYVIVKMESLDSLEAVPDYVPIEVVGVMSGDGRWELRLAIGAVFNVSNEVDIIRLEA